MATIREYFNSDFTSAVKLYATLPIIGPDVECTILYDFEAYAAFIACYVAGTDRTPQFFKDFVEGLKLGETTIQMGDRIRLPTVRSLPGELTVQRGPTLTVSARFFGETDHISNHEILSTRRLFIYSETQLEDTEIANLKAAATAAGHALQFRSTKHAKERSRHETPLAFISHNSRDKEIVARKIALNLQKKLCPVWYDEFSLKVGDRLRDSIEYGLKTCHKCIVVLSHNFFSNIGWSKTKFDSIFTREILEGSNLILPVWVDVSKSDVYNYSPSLLNVKGLDWNQLGEEMVCIKLHQAIMPT